MSDTPEQPVTGAPEDATAPGRPSAGQIAGVVISTLLLLTMTPLVGLGVIPSAIAGIAAFLDARAVGIRKDPDRAGFLNISPMGWAIVVAWLLIVAYPAYLFHRATIKSHGAPPIYFIILNVFGVISIALSLLPYFIGPIGPTG